MRIFINNNIYLFILILLYTINITLSLLVEENQPCNTERDILLATDPSHNPQAYLKCVSANIGTIGFWNKKFCSPDTKFDFASQSCIDNTNNNGITFNFNSFKSYPTTTNQGNLYNPTFEEIPQPIPETPLKVAILNNTCINGETCIGGTVCDKKKGKCLCPFGTFPNVATLSCDNDEGSPMIVSSVQEEDGTFKFTFRKQSPYSQNINDLIIRKDGGNNFDKIDFIDIKNIPTTSTIKPFTFLESLFSKPGEKCSDGKICTGGSLCITSSMLCLCPGTLIEKDGECVNPSNGVPAVEKVRVGGLCNSYTECLDESSCILGRCRCVLPLLEVNGKCILKIARKEVGPGEVCENGEICTKGSICDSTIPVCICPSGTDLNENEECVPVITTSKTILPSTIKNIPIIIQKTPRPVTFSTTSRPITFPATQKFIYQTIKKNNEYYTQPTIMITTTQPTTTTIPFTTTSKTIINTIYTQPTIGYTKLSKPLSIGAKFLKVGEICSLNTDCMIGAYCNGNSSPPSCQCLSTHVNVNGKCEKVIYPGQYGCKSDIQCSTSYPGASCHDRQCVCPLNYRAVEQTCVSELLINNKLTFFSIFLTKNFEPLKFPSYFYYLSPKENNNFTINPKSFQKHTFPGTGYFGGSSIKKFKKNNLMLKKVVKRQVKIQSISEFYKTNEYKNQLLMSKKYLKENSNRDDFVCLPGQFTCAKNNGVCYQSICYCFEGYYPDYQKSECLPIVNQFEEQKKVGTYVELGNNCKIHIDRCLGGSFCDPATSICLCPKGSIISKSNNTCLQPPGNSCAKGEICTNGSFCDFGVCLCLPSHQIVNNFCVIKIVSLNGICLSGERCMPGLVCLFGRCTNDVIEKRKDIKNFKNNLPKTAISRIGEKCLVSENCYGNSLCLNGFCKCQQNIEYEVDGNCKRLMKPITCPVGQIENEGSCIEEKSHEKPSKTEIFSKIKKQENFRLPIPGEICTDKCGSGAFCNNGICQCPPTSVVDFFGRCKSILSTSSQSTKHRSPSLIHSTTILKAKFHSLPGESCLVEETNCLGYSVCKNSICSCPDGKILQGNVCLDGGKNFPQIIIRKLEYDDRVFNEGEIECNENDKDFDIGIKEASCPGGMKCYKNKCLCEIGYALKEGECQLNEAGSLIENEECAYTVQCTDNLTCLNGFSTDRLISPPGGSCGDDETCTGGSICKNDWCVCPEINMIVVNGLCLTSDILASTKVFEVPTTIQTPQKQNNMEYNQIIPRPDINILSKYSQISNTNDLPTFVETIQSKVEQPTVQEVKLGGRKVAPGMNCGPLDVCVGGSSCFDNYCVCPTGLVVDTNSGRCITPDDNEENSAEDKTETINENNLVTSNEFNKESYIGDKMSSFSNTNTNNNNKQPSKITLSSSSSNDDECVINGLICRGGAICVDGSCQCPKNYILLNDQCLPPTGRRYSQRRGKPNFLLEDNVALPNESCSNGETCLGGSICQDEKICQCPNDKNNIVDGVCVNDSIKEKYYGVGEECSIDKKCTSNAECHQGLCRCMAGYIAISNDCIQLPTAQSQSITNNAPNSDDSMKTLNSGYGSTGQIGHSDDDKPKPRFVAPSIRRPKNNSKKSKNGGISTMNGDGTCPPGNSPTRDESTNRVISCNGMTPNCPPRSYCYVTGPADGNYNCCKSF